jgi:tetratricopeptide (TPR) repeat protein
MSLLMKALEQAAKDRGEAQKATAAAPAGESNLELTLALEPLPGDASATRTGVGRAPNAQASAVGSAPSAREQARSAAVTQGGGGVRSSARIDGQRSINPVIVFGVLAGLFAIGFAAYVYVQINHPGLLARRSPLAGSPPPAAPLAPTPLAATPAASAVLPIPSSAVLESPAHEPQVAPPAPPVPLVAIHPVPAANPVAPAPSQPLSAAPASKIVISRGTPTIEVNPLLVEAHRALQAAEVEIAQRLYSQLAEKDARSIDAWLGLAAVALQQGKPDEATRHYLRILELDPRHALAQAGLIGLLGRGDPLAAETRLKQLIGREPSAYLYFTLGNLYADQSLWAQAQHAYFQAHHLDPGNPDYAYNLAVGLEHLGQPRLALGYYRQALGLAAGRGQINFDAARARDRLSRLAAQVE